MLFLLALACTKTPDDTAPPVVDLREEYPAPPEGGLSFATPDFEIPPLSERQMCYLTTYTGPTVGVNAGNFMQNEDFGHHVLIMVSNEDEDDYPDGSSWDCTATEDLRMENLEPILFTQRREGADFDMELPENMAVKLREGSRILMQSHYLNTSENPILVNDQINLVVLPEAEVETWAAPWAHTKTNLSIPPGEYSQEITCTFEQDTYLLNTSGHMHEWGVNFTLDMHKLDGSTERIYEIPEWDIQYRDVPPQDFYEPGAMLVRAGESFTSTCTWFNDTDSNLDFPHEMCAAAGMAYPTVVPIICDYEG